MSTHRPPSILISGSLGLDFLNTLATPVDTQIDWIDDGGWLLAWLEQARLVPAKDLQALKACEGSTGTLLFVDRTRGRARRWCSMAICGNRAKQEAHRNRRKAAQ